MNKWKWTRQLIFLALLLGAGFYIWPSDARVVTRRTKALLAAMSKDGPENMAVAAARVFEAASYLSSEVKIITGHPYDRTLDKSDVINMLQLARRHSSFMVVKSRGIDTARLAEDEMQVDAVIDVTVEYQGDREEWIGNYRFIWQLIEGKWLVKKVDPIEIIQHPSGRLPEL